MYDGRRLSRATHNCMETGHADARVIGVSARYYALWTHRVCCRRGRTLSDRLAPPALSRQVPVQQTNGGVETSATKNLASHHQPRHLEMF